MPQHVCAAALSERLNKVLEVRNISIAYNEHMVIKDVSFSVQSGETVCIVGESGSGKSTILRAIQGLLGREGRVARGSIDFNGVALLSLNKEEMRKYRGAIIATVPQQAGLSMDPITKIGKQFHEAILTKKAVSGKESDKLAADCMRSLSLKNPERILNSYPVMLSGGTNQRVALAMAMVMEPQLILADEPTSALDVTVQVEVVEAMQALKHQCDAAILLVTHNMGVVAQMADHVGVMYNGRMLEWGSCKDILHHPHHPYTKELMSSVLRMDGRLPQVKTVYRESVEEGCVYYSRCPFAKEMCRQCPDMRTCDGHLVMCHYAEEVKEDGK